MGGPGSGRRNKYHWRDRFARDRFVIVQGRDYQVPTESVVAQIKSYASVHHHWVAVTVRDGGGTPDRVEVRVLGRITRKGRRKLAGRG